MLGVFGASTIAYFVATNRATRTARRRDLVSLCVFGASFLVINAILIVLAAVSG